MPFFKTLVYDCLGCYLSTIFGLESNKSKGKFSHSLNNAEVIFLYPSQGGWLRQFYDCFVVNACSWFANKFCQNDHGS